MLRGRVTRRAMTLHCGVGQRRAIGALVSIFSAQGAYAQPQPQPLVAGTCGAAVVRFDRVSELRSPPGGPTIGPNSMVTANSTGELFWGPSLRGSQVAVFSRDGRYLRAIGHPSPELRRWWGIDHLVVGPGDSIHIVDYERSAWVVLSPAGTFVRQASIPRNLRSIRPMPDGTLLIAADFQSRDRFGMPLHRLAADGQFVSSFGESKRSATLAGDRPRRYVIAPAKDGSGVWAAAQFTLEITQWSLDGKPGAALRLDLPGANASPTPEQLLFDTSPPPTHIGQVYERRDGLLWVTVRKADRSWTGRNRSSYLPETVASPGSLNDLNTYYDTELLLVDPARRCIVARGESRSYLSRTLADDVVTSRRQDATGVIVDVWRMRLESHNKEE